MPVLPENINQELQFHEIGFQRFDFGSNRVKPPPSGAHSAAPLSPAAPLPIDASLAPPPAARPPELLHTLGPVFCVCYFLWLAGDGLNDFFTSDDALNLAYLHGYFHIPLSEIFQQALAVFTTGYRPLGGLFYRLLYSVFGFDPFPFRVAAFTLMGINLFLAYHLVRNLSGSREAALVATFLLSYNASFWELYHNTGTVYEILCFGFFVSAFLVYLDARQGSGRFGIKKTAYVLILYGCALGSKEMAVSFSVALLLYEVFYHPNQFRRRDVLAGLLQPHFLLIAGLAIVTALFLAVKLLSNNPLSGHSGYTPDVSLGQFATALTHFLPRWLYWPSLGEAGTLALVFAAAAVAFLTRAKELMFGICFLLVALLPIAFILLRAGFAFYLPALGCVLFFGSAIARMIRRVFQLAESVAGLGSHQNLKFMALRSVPFLGLVLVLTPIHRATSGEATIGSYSESWRQVISDLQSMHSTFPDRSVLSFEDDPYPNSYTNTLLFLIQLAYNNPTIRVERRGALGFHPREEQRFFSFTVRERRVEPVLRPLSAADSSQNVLRIAFQPETVRPGENISVQLEEFAGVTIDVCWNLYGADSRFKEGDERYIQGMSPKWCSFDKEGLCIAPLLKHFPQSRVEIYVRESGKEQWRPTVGVLKVLR